MFNYVKQHRQIIIVILLMLALVRLLPAAAQRTITLDEYRRLIGDANSQAQAAINQPEQCRTILGHVAETLTAVTHVQLPDGTIMPVNHAGAAQILGATPCNPQAAIAYLSGICPTRLCPVTAPQNNEPQPDMPGTMPPANNTSQPTDSVPAGATTAAAQPPAVESSPPTNDAEPVPPNITDSPSSEPGAADAGYPAGGSANPASTANAGYPAANSDNPTDAASNAPTSEAGTPNEDGSSAESATQVADDAADNPEMTPLPNAASPDATEEAAAPVANEEAVDEENRVEETAVSTPESETSTAEADNQNHIQLITMLFFMALVLLLLGVYLWRKHLVEEERRRQRQGKPTSTAAAVAEGRQQLAEENYREAVRQLFLATLMALEERGILQFDKTLTNYELLTKMRGNPNMMTTLRAVVSTVERVWYGYEPIAAHDYEALVVKIDALRFVSE